MKTGSALVLFVTQILTMSGAWALDGEALLQQLAGRQAGRSFALKWTDDGRCMAAQANRGVELAWKTVSANVCQNFRDFAKTHTEELHSRNLLDKNAPKRPLLAINGYDPVGTLAYDDVKLVVSFKTWSQCDSAGKCTPRALDRATELGQLLRRSVTRELGRLPSL